MNGRDLGTHRRGSAKDRRRPREHGRNLGMNRCGAGMSFRVLGMNPLGLEMNRAASRMNGRGSMHDGVAMHPCPQNVGRMKRRLVQRAGPGPPAMPEQDRCLLLWNLRQPLVRWHCHVSAALVTTPAAQLVRDRHSQGDGNGKLKRPRSFAFRSLRRRTLGAANASDAGDGRGVRLQGCLASLHVHVRHLGVAQSGQGGAHAAEFEQRDRPRSGEHQRAGTAREQDQAELGRPPESFARCRTLRVDHRERRRWRHNGQRHVRQPLLLLSRRRER